MRQNGCISVGEWRVENILYQRVCIVEVGVVKNPNWKWAWLVSKIAHLASP